MSVVRPLVIVATSRDVHAALAHVHLSAAEEARAQRMVRADDAHDFRAAHLLARRALALATDTPDGALVPQQSCAACGESHGRPTVVGEPDVHIAWAHTRGAVAVVVAGAPCGIDIERNDGRPVPRRVVERVLSPAEAELVRASSRPDRAFLEAWGVKESLVKAGEGDLADQVRREVVGQRGIRAPGERDHAVSRIAVALAPERSVEGVVRVDHDADVSTVTLILGAVAAPERISLTTGEWAPSHAPTRGL
ncbi:4'-phosphopantetheinyl transferase family protein [Sanguibacter sp. A247]|uniref:4'-phosphopantetheinyl transferase family protein n=1 Tax=unclassified Sanguibacter TaxID=2645534 RepID=UPI003FD8E9CC